MSKQIANTNKSTIEEAMVHVSLTEERGNRHCHKSPILNRPMCRKLGIAFILLAFLAGCAPSAPTPNPPAYWPTDGWRSTAPEEQGMDSEKLAQMVEQIKQEKLELHSLLVVRNGYLVSEFYNYPYSASQPGGVMSVTKSVMSALIGVAIQKGYIKDVQQPLLSLLPDLEAANLDDRKKAIKLEDLLTMTSGLDCHENPAPGEPFMQASENWVQFMLDLPMAAQPGTKFNYCTATVELLSAVLQKATGMSARKFANANLFGPLGIGPIEENRWPSDPQGVTVGGYGLALTPGEMAKLGYLFVNQGQWDGKTVVPADWVATSTASHADRGDKKEYGYLWWIDPKGNWYAALGLGGQHIFVYPAENLVVVSTADLPLGNDADLLPVQDLIEGYILPSVKSAKPLPANPDGLARLQAGIKALGGPEITAPQPLPPIATQISGKTYTLGENPFGWETMILGFQNGADEATVTTNGLRQVKVGLDNAYREFRVDDKTFPQEFRGHWEGLDTFVVDALMLGNGAIGYGTQFTFRIQFSGDSLHISAQEKHSPGTIEVDGTLKPAAK